MRQSLLTAALVLAAPVAAAAPLQSTAIDPVVVTATRTAEPASDALVPVIVITRADIDRLQPTSVRDLLRGLPGVSFANSGGMGQQTSLFLRGTNSAHTLVLIDGVRIGSVGAGLAAYEQIPVDQIQRIEIVRGPRSSLYGSDAIGGVIQIFTRRGKAGEAATPSLSLTGGTYNTWDGHAGLSGGSAHGWYNVSVGSQYTHGINSCRLGAGTVFAGCFTNEPDKDGYRDDDALLNGGYRWDNGAELAANLLHAKSYVEYDGSYQNQSRHAQQVAGARLGFDATGAWHVTLTAGQNLDKATNYEQRRYVGFGDSTRDQAGWQNDITLAARQTLSVGADWSRESIASDTAYLIDARSNVGAYAQYQGDFGRNEVQLSVRRDHNQQFGNHVTGAAAWGYRFDGGLRLGASWGSAFHAPTFNDVYYPYGLGNPDLKPESSRSVELDLGAWHARWHWQLSAYRTVIDDLIGYGPAYVPVNINRAHIRGVEGQLAGDWAGWTLHAYATWQQPRDAGGGANDGHLLPRRFQRSARLDLDRRVGTVGLGATLQAVGARYDDAANLHRLGGYALLDLRASVRLRAHWQLQARVANVLGHRYETAWYYNQPGRTFYLTVRYRPGTR